MRVGEGQLCDLAVKQEERFGMCFAYTGVLCLNKLSSKIKHNTIT